jgi:hypothetical protein
MIALPKKYATPPATEDATRNPSRNTLPNTALIPLKFDRLFTVVFKDTLSLPKKVLRRRFEMALVRQCPLLAKCGHKEGRYSARDTNASVVLRKVL